MIWNGTDLESHLASTVVLNGGYVFGWVGS